MNLDDKGEAAWQEYLTDTRVKEDTRMTDDTKGIGKLDAGKPRFALIPSGPLREIAKVLTFGAAKYGANNWKIDNPRERYSDALLRHVFSYTEGERNDPESGLHHLAHACCCALFIMAFDDKPWAGSQSISSHNLSGLTGLATREAGP